ncbi:hypothetical protein MPL3356_80093 [Mesorhizobium plurifarium]|uniref:Uncharacterized protein n=2 Tax=Mesorhizobium plurifarium TaxID=69974 RepID=A0A090GB64_MESPL|nr:hypothetical protein MPL3356_80093 [Mesorhizobium plurifarium]
MAAGLRFQKAFIWLSHENDTRIAGAQRRQFNGENTCSSSRGKCFPSRPRRSLRRR